MKLSFSAITAVVLASFGTNAFAQEHEHSHPAPEKLGTVHFENSCAKEVQQSLDHAVALLHSFAYDVSAREFAAIAIQDPGCAMAHWGVAMTKYHQLWDSPKGEALKSGADEITAARKIGAKTPRERELIAAAGTFYSDTDAAHHALRARNYAVEMEAVAQHFPKDDEVQTFFALSLLGTAAPTDRTHANQKQAAAILEPIYRKKPDHPGAAHYLIHAYDSTELAKKGLPAARAYSKIAPAAPHALHMPSHIFTRLGLWPDSIESNEAARHAAHEQGDVGEELHAMDYLTYAYLQLGKEAEAQRIVEQVHSVGPLTKEFKVSYAATAMPIRLAIEGDRWDDVLSVEPIAGSPPHVTAIAHWAHALAHSRDGQTEAAARDIDQIDACGRLSAAAGDAYWSAQVEVLGKEARAWNAKASGKNDEAVSLLSAAADAEDALEKLPVTPGPIVPAREQLGRLLLELNRPREAVDAFNRALKDAPGRRAALADKARAEAAAKS